MKKICPICQEPYSYRLQIKGDRCLHDDQCGDLRDPEKMTPGEESVVRGLRKNGMGKNEFPVKGRDGIIRFVEKGG
jgi:hypothetical protein